ncbi:MAG: tRNA (guanosine(46)-N7)-methyltransferase TrmB [Actinobacteria bacterium]|nr:tRNA (guanosine(46)-N7)-methyltransferase TrmB [Actinomycetota bacterium]
MVRPVPPASTVMPRGVRTFKPRRSRITRREAAALEDSRDVLLTSSRSRLPLSWGEVPIVLEIGFGAGEATRAMAVAEPETTILAVDVHTPGVGRLVADVRGQGITNVLVMEADALTVLEDCIPPNSLSSVRTFFPDPWPKARHHKRRLIQGSVIDLVYSRLTPGGSWHIATDWPDYLEWILGAFDAHPGFDGGIIDRPESRPITHYERRAISEGRGVADLEFTKGNAE